MFKVGAQSESVCAGRDGLPRLILRVETIMSQAPHPQPVIFCGIDVSARTLAVAVQPDRQREFANTAAGHQRLIAWLSSLGAARVSLEATGIYSLDLALALDATPSVQCQVLNPKAVHRFAQTLRRSKTDKADAQTLAEYSQRMPFVPWQPPSPQALRLRSIGRHLESLATERVRDHNRLDAAEGSRTTPACVLQDLRRSIKSLDRRIRNLRRQAVVLVRQDHLLSRHFELLTAMPGIAETSALHLLGELAALPAGLSVRQWVAHSGLDPVHQSSGTSVHKPSKISRAGSRHLRRALYMPALVAARRDPHLRAFYQNLLARQKAKLQALIAVARKMLHAIYGIFKHQKPYNGAMLFPNLIPTS
jgi:transposase